MVTDSTSTQRPEERPGDLSGPDQLRALNGATHGDVVAAVDGSPSSLAAVEWAGAEAERLGRRLHLVYVIDPETRYNPYFTLEQLRGDARRVVTDAADRVRASRPHLPILDHAVVAKPAKALIGGSQGAALLVLGRRGHGALGRLLLGSVSANVAGHATVPTAVVPKNWDLRANTGKPVVVGVDGTPASDTALRYAAQLAAHRDAPLRIVHAWGHEPTFAVDPALIVTQVAAWSQQAQTLLEDAATACRLTFPELTITTEAPHGPVVTSLVSESDQAQALVVGGRQVTRLQAALVGSTTYGVLHQGHVPVVVVHTGH